MNRNIFLTGFMGAGKSTVAHELQQSCGMHLIEMDEQIEAQEGRKISQIFDESGEEYFRMLETELLKGMERQENTVVSCGGGVPLRSENVSIMRKNGVIVLLSAKPETIFERVKDAHTRPLLEGNMSLEYIKNLMAERMPGYQAAADITIQTDDINVKEICVRIRRFISQICG